MNHLIHINRPCTTHFIYCCHCRCVIVWIKMWVLWNLLHKAFRPNNAALSSKIFMCCWDSSDQKSPPVLLPAIDPPHSTKDASVFNTIDGLGLRIGAKESIILLFHQYIFALLSFETIINVSKFLLLILMHWFCLFP